MPKSKSAEQRKPIPKPDKPYKDFPLYPLAIGKGYWAKRIRGKLHYFGRWEEGWEKALKRYNRDRDNLHLGQAVSGDQMELADACNIFLAAKQKLRDAGQIAAKTYLEYEKSAENLLEQFGRTAIVQQLAPVHFERYHVKLCKRLGPVRLGKEIQLVRTLFKYLFDCGLIDKPIRFGLIFRGPSKRLLRLNANRRTQTFTTNEIHALIRHTRGQLRAMIFLGINCGLGNTDCAKLSWKNVDLETGFLDFPRNKTGIGRRSKLWPETIQALKECRSDGSKRVFTTKYGHVWHESAIGHELYKVMKSLGLHVDGRNFYAFRHTFATVASGTKDQIAVDYCMGHVSPGIGTVYRHGIEDGRLENVASYVRNWLGQPDESALSKLKKRALPSGRKPDNSIISGIISKKSPGADKVKTIAK